MDSYDVVVVGAGSSGCAAAGRLAARTDLRICLLEAGPDYGPLADGRWPAEILDAAEMPRTHDWGYFETRDRELRRESRAKIVGGCSAHNQCAAVWPQLDEFDAWNIPGWTSAELEPLVAEVDRIIAPAPHADHDLSSWQRVWLDAGISSGFPRLANIGESGQNEGAAPFHANVRAGVRWSAAFAFLDAVRRRPNLTVRPDTYVEALVDGADTATLTCRDATGHFELRARRCLLAAGAYGSPAILLRSGLGPEGVGANLHDHFGARVRFQPSTAAVQALEDDFERNRFRQSQVCIRARTPDAKAFDVHVVPFQAQTDEGEWTFQAFAFVLAPRSRGRFTVDGDVPTIDFGFLSDPHDERALDDALAIARRIAESEPLASAIDEELEPADTEARTTMSGYAHAVGTCALGTVLGPDCRVRGTSNVAVADASIIPKIPRANPNLTCFLIGLRGADMLLDEVGP